MLLYWPHTIALVAYNGGTSVGHGPVRTLFLGLILCLVQMTPCETMLYWPSPNCRTERYALCGLGVPSLRSLWGAVRNGQLYILRMYCKSCIYFNFSNFFCDSHDLPQTKNYTHLPQKEITPLDDFFVHDLHGLRGIRKFGCKPPTGPYPNAPTTHTDLLVHVDGKVRLVDFQVQPLGLFVLSRDLQQCIVAKNHSTNAELSQSSTMQHTVSPPIQMQQNAACGRAGEKILLEVDAKPLAKNDPRVELQKVENDEEKAFRKVAN